MTQLSALDKQFSPGHGARMSTGESFSSPLPAGSNLVDLDRELNIFSLSNDPRGCLVTIRNNTTIDREALIVAAGVHFSFYEGHEPGSTKRDYMAGPVHVEVAPNVTVPFRFSDRRYPVYSVRVGIKVLFGSTTGFPSAVYDNFFWEQTLGPIALIQPAPLYPRVGELHLDFRLKRDAKIVPPRPLVLPPLGSHWPPIPGPLTNANPIDWFELTERPR